MDSAQVKTYLSTYFNPSTSTIRNATPELLREVDAALGFPLTEEELVALSGAPSNSTLLLDFVAPYTEKADPNDPVWKKEKVPGGIRLRLSNKTFIRSENVTIIYATDGGDLGVYFKLVKLTKAFKTRGTAALMTQSVINAIQGLNPGISGAFVEITLLAAGGRFWGNDDDGERWIGYNVWPKFGFDMPLHRVTEELKPYFPNYPAGLGGCGKVSEVLALNEEGKEFWKVAGDGSFMTFDLAGNVSKGRLATYISEIQ